MNQTEAFSNYNFLIPVSEDLYRLLFNAEKYARTDYVNCSRAMRDALECFTGVLETQRQLTLEGTLENKISTLQDLGILNENGSHSVLTRGGYYITINDWDFLRRFGNSGSHNSDPHPENLLVLKYDVCLKALKLVQRIMASIFSLPVPSFNEMRMPIEDYFILSGRSVNETGTGCKYEFEGIRLNENGGTSCYSIIRQYPKASISRNFIIREKITFDTATRLSDTLPGGMPNIDVINPLDLTESDSYIISYNFNQKPVTLESSLPSLNEEQKKEIILTIAEYISFFHSCEPVICHRMLDHTCIYLCKIGKRMVPKLTKFNFARIDEYQTVRSAAKQGVKTVKSYNRIYKYFADEIRRGMDEDTDYLKADIYSFGILIIDILTGKIQDKKLSEKEMIQKGIKAETAAVIKDMTTANISGRPDAEEALRRLREVL